MKSFIFTLLVGLISVPIVLLSLKVLIIKLYFDRDKVKYKIGTKTSRSYLSCRFLQPNRRWKRLLLKPNHKDYSIEKSSEAYIIDQNCIYDNEDGYPQIDYFEGIPMPINYSVLWDKVKLFLEYFHDDQLGALTDEDKELIELSFSAENLQNFKKDKIFREFHTSSNDIMKLVGMFAMIMFGMMFVWIMSMIFMR